jgi:hypothetical protein
MKLLTLAKAGRALLGVLWLLVTVLVGLVTALIAIALVVDAIDGPGRSSPNSALSLIVFAMFGLPAALVGMGLSLLGLGGKFKRRFGWVKLSCVSAIVSFLSAGVSSGIVAMVSQIL